jgi:hypothetical protein
VTTPAYTFATKIPGRTRLATNAATARRRSPEVLHSLQSPDGHEGADDADGEHHDEQREAETYECVAWIVFIGEEVVDEIRGDADRSDDGCGPGRRVSTACRRTPQPPQEHDPDDHEHNSDDDLAEDDRAGYLVFCVVREHPVQHSRVCARHHVRHTERIVAA